jgi:hypothetical protein
MRWIMVSETTDGEQWVAYCGTQMECRDVRRLSPFTQGPATHLSFFCVLRWYPTADNPRIRVNVQLAVYDPLPCPCGEPTSPNHSPYHNDVPTLVTLHPREATTPYLSYFCPTISPRSRRKGRSQDCSSQPRSWVMPASPGGYG